MPLSAIRNASRGQPVLLGLGFLLLTVVGAAAVWLTLDARQETRVLLRTLEIENRLAVARRDLRRAESSQRGYLLTGDRAFVLEFDRAVAGRENAMTELGQLTAGDARQQQLVADVASAMHTRDEQLREGIRLHDAGAATTAAAMVGSSLARERNEAIRVRTDAMSAEAQRLFNERSEAARRTSGGLLAATLLGIALVFVLAAASIFSVRRSNRERDKALLSLAHTNANLEATVAERTADLREANEEIQRFAYIVSHDLRSPLVNIMGFTSELEALRGEVFDELRKLRDASAAAAALVHADGEGKHDALGRDFDEALGFIKTSISKMDRLINAILRLSREGRRDFKPEPVDVKQLFESVGESLAHQAAEADATVTIGDLPPVVSDRLALEQVFSNLLDNALKYLRPGQPGRIEVRGRRTPRQVVYEVVDNGRGIDPKDHQRIFDLFRRAGEQDRPGEGIGLAHVRALVRRLGGSLTVKSELGTGSVFTVTLPSDWAEPKEKVAA